MREPRRRFTEDFKRDAVRLADKSPQPLAEVARSLGVGYATLDRWYDASMAKRSKKTASNMVAMPPGKENVGGGKRQAEASAQAPFKEGRSARDRPRDP